jgi:hypothetical protein
MSRLEDLPHDHKAALSLLLRRGESYADLAGLLNIPERAVHDRAHAALAMLAPREARVVPPERREEIGEFMLGQQRGEADRASTLSYLRDSAEARAWARALAGELSTLPGGVVPELPGEATPADNGSLRGASALAPPPAPLTTAPGDVTAPRAASRTALPVSREAGAALLAALAAIALAGILWAAGVFSSGGGSPSRHAASAASSPSTTSSRGGSTSAEGKAPKQDKRITLTATDPASGARGVAVVLSEGSKYGFYLAAEHLPQSQGFFYAVWLYNSPTSAEPLGKSPPVKSNGILQGGSLLPANASHYTRMIITRETNEHPSHPGPIVLGGAFALH